MRFDDRLKTVLGLPARSHHDRAVRWRQLVELLGRAGGPATEQVEQALVEIRSERDQVDEPIRAATARAIARPYLPADLVTYFAEDKVTVAAPVLASASLTSEQWSSVLAAASAECRPFILSLHPDLQKETAVPETSIEKTAEPESPVDDVAVPAPTIEQPAVQEAIPSISEVVARFERLREERRRAESNRAAIPAHAPAQGGNSLFRWETGPSGEIAWVEGVPRGALVGRSLVHSAEGNGVDERILRALSLRSPFRDGLLHVGGDGPASGEWKLSGIPAFEPLDGRFAGYRGVAVRSAGEAGARLGPAGLDDDSLRELVHEIRTPLNAIIGFAEIIDSQYLGPADFAYRERAAQIVAQARMLLTAVEDLDLIARLRSSDSGRGGETSLSDILPRLFEEWLGNASVDRADVRLGLVGPNVKCGLNPEICERIVRRFLAGALGDVTGGSTPVLSLFTSGDRCEVEVSGRPVGETVESDQPAALQSDFSLRLADALAQLAGGELASEDDRLSLKLPAA